MLEYRTGSTYDAIFPLGGGCAISFQLNHRGKRLFATPFDWTLIPDLRGIEYLPDGIASDFSKFLQRENLKEFAPVRTERGHTTYSYEDTETGFQFVHHFHTPVAQPGSYEMVRSAFDRRLQRTFDFVENASRVLFVLNTKFEFDAEYANRIHQALVARFPHTTIHLLVMQFKATANKREELPGGVVIERFSRHMNDSYDMQKTAAEWEFLDWIQLTGVSSSQTTRRKSFIVKIAYKIWIHLGKWLERRRAGCLSVRFKTFGEETCASRRF